MAPSAPSSSLANRPAVGLELSMSCCNLRFGGGGAAHRWPLLLSLHLASPHLQPESPLERGNEQNHTPPGRLGQKKAQTDALSSTGS